MNEIEQILYDVAYQVAIDYQNELRSFDSIASGTLNNVDFEVEIKGGTYKIYLILQDYWKYVEYGRKPGKFPNVGKLQEWIKIKPVLPRPLTNGILPTEKQLSFLIGRSIKEKGIQPKPALANVLQKNDAYLNRIKEAVSKSLDKEIKQMLKELNK